MNKVTPAQTLKMILLFFKGLLIGMAVILPGVSGGTMALITGLYSPIISALSSVRLLTFFKKKEFLAFWNPFSHLAFVFAGILIGFFIMVQWVSFFIYSYPLPAYSFFSGLILSSVFFLTPYFKKKWPELVIFILSLSLVFFVSFFDSLFFSGYFWIFFSVYLAVGAMLLPGVSGSYVLVIMGTYSIVLKELSDFSWLGLLFLITGGVSLLTCSRGLKYLLKHYLSWTMAGLMGMMLGGGTAVFPVKSISALKEHGLLAFSFLLIGALATYGLFILNKRIHSAH